MLPGLFQVPSQQTTIRFMNVIFYFFETFVIRLLKTFLKRTAESLPVTPIPAPGQMKNHLKRSASKIISILFSHTSLSWGSFKWLYFSLVCFGNVVLYILSQQNFQPGYKILVIKFIELFKLIKFSIILSTFRKVF